MLDLRRVEVFVPVDDQLFAEIVCLVYQQKKLFFSSAHLTDILFKVCGVEKVRVSSVDDLQPHCQCINYNLPR